MNEVQNYQHATNLAQIHILPENQDYDSTLTSRGHSKSSSSVTPDNGHLRKNLVTLTSFIF